MTIAKQNTSTQAKKSEYEKREIHDFIWHTFALLILLTSQLMRALAPTRQRAQQEARVLEHTAAKWTTRCVNKSARRCKKSVAKSEKTKKRRVRPIFCEIKMSAAYGSRGKGAKYVKF